MYVNCEFKYLDWTNFQMNEFICLAKPKCWFVIVGIVGGMSSMRSDLLWAHIVGALSKGLPFAYLIILFVLIMLEYKKKIYMYCV
jgi:hypothetical protein